MHIAGFRTTETQQLRPALTYILWTPEGKVACWENQRHGRNF